jgi:hypothetical protein
MRNPLDVDIAAGAAMLLIDGIIAAAGIARTEELQQKNPRAKVDLLDLLAKMPFSSVCRAGQWRPRWIPLRLQAVLS